MSNTKKTAAPLRRGPQHRQGHGRHREPPRTPGDLVAVPGQAGLRVLAAGALGSAALMSMPAGMASAASAPGPVAASLTASVRPAPAPGVPAPQLTVPQLPDVTFNLPQPVPFLDLPAGTPGLLSTTAPAPAVSAPISDNTAPSPGAQPGGAVSGSISGALGPVGGTLGLSCGSANCALTIGYLAGFGGSARVAVSPSPPPTAFSVDAGAQASANVGGVGLTGGGSVSLTNPNGLQLFGRVSTPVGVQGTVSGTVPPSVLAGIGEADSNAAAAEAGLYAAPPPPPPTPNQQVAQGFADLANIGTGSGPSLASVLAGIGEADSNAAAAEAGLYAAPPPTPTQLTPAQRIDQGFSPVSANDPASIVQQDFAALTASGVGAGTGAGDLSNLLGLQPAGPVAGQLPAVPYISNLTTPDGTVINPLTPTAIVPATPAAATPAPADQAPAAPAGQTPPASGPQSQADPAQPSASVQPGPTDQPSAPVAAAPDTATVPPVPVAAAPDIQPPAPAPVTPDVEPIVTDSQPAAPDIQPPAPAPVTPDVEPIVTDSQPAAPDITAPSPTLVASADPTSVNSAPAAVAAPAPVLAGIGPVVVAGGFSGGGFSGGGSA